MRQPVFYETASRQPAFSQPHLGLHAAAYVLQIFYLRTTRDLSLFTTLLVSARGTCTHISRHTII